MGFPAKLREKGAARRDTRPQSVWPPLLVKRFVFCVNATSTNGVGLVTHFYKGVGVGTFLHPHDLRISGITPAKPTANFDLAAVTQHVSRGVIMSPCISVTRSYAVAEDYARNAATSPPTRVAPAYVYVIDVPDAVRTGITMCDLSNMLRLAIGILPPVLLIITMAVEGSFSRWSIQSYISRF